MTELVDDRLAQRLADFARSAGAGRGVEQTVQTIVDAAVTTIAGADAAGVSLLTPRGRIEVLSTTDELVTRIDALQSELGEGPCLDTARKRDVVRVPDLAVEERWPRFGPPALDLGVRSMLSIRLLGQGRGLGSLSLFSGRPGAFTEESEYDGLLFATHAAVALAGARRERELTEGLERRDVIGQAKGILVERHRITSQAAFLALAQASQDSNVKVREVAEQLVLEANRRADPTGG